MGSKAKGGRRPSRKSSSKKRNGAAQGIKEAPPELPSLEDAPRWGDVEPSGAQRLAYDRWVAELAADAGVSPEEFSLGCVCRLDRGFPALLVPDGIVRGEHGTTMAKEDDLRPAVGDWTVVRRPAGHDMAVVEKVLPRQSDIARWRGGSRGERQTLAANVDVVLIVQALSDKPLSIDRLARAATVVADCGSAWAVVLTKVDRAPDAKAVGQAVEAVHGVLGEETPVVALAQLDRPVERRQLGTLADTVESHGGAFGLGALKELIGPGTVSMCLGESGVGKSTLLNALLGHEVMETGKVRSRDDAGRHTTVTRRMLKVPDAGVVIDCPGLRSLPLVGHERGLAQVFPAIAEAAAECRFRDCTHDMEPGCAVKEALAAGAFGEESYGIYRALAAEMRSSARSLDPDVVL